MELELEQHIQEYDTHEDKKRMINEKISKAKEEQEFFISLFPRSEIRNIDILDYVQGKSEGKTKTFAYLIEFGSSTFGKIGGGFAIKFGVYMNAETQVFEFRPENFESYAEAYDNTINVIADCLDHAKNFIKTKDWKIFSDRITELIESKDGTPPIGVISKIIAMYYPDEFIRMWSHNWLNNTLDAFQIKRDDLPEGKKLGTFYEKMGRLMEMKNSHPIIQKWSNEYFSYSIGEYVNLKIKEKNSSSEDLIANNGEVTPMSSSSKKMWHHPHMGNYEKSYVQTLGEKFVKELDGKETTPENKKRFMEIMNDSVGINSNQEAVKAFGKYVMQLRVYAIGTSDEKFIASNACKYYLVHKKDSKLFILSHMLRWQYPNGTTQPNNPTPKSIIPFVFTLKVLLKLSEKLIEEAYLSKDEILSVVTQANTMDEVESVAEIILKNRTNDTTYLLKETDLPSDAWSSANRLFASFKGTGLITVSDSSTNPKKLILEPHLIMEAKNILAAYNPKVINFNTKEEWDNYHGVNK